VRHIFTHRDVTAEVFDIEVRRLQPSVAAAATAEILWADERRLDGLAVSSFLRKLLGVRKQDKPPDPP